MTMDELKARHAEMNAAIAHAKLVPVIENLFDRWQDEKEYEDWADYEKVIRNQVNGLDLVGASLYKIDNRSASLKVYIAYKGIVTTIQVTTVDVKVESRAA